MKFGRGRARNAAATIFAASAVLTALTSCSSNPIGSDQPVPSGTANTSNTEGQIDGATVPDNAVKVGDWLVGFTPSATSEIRALNWRTGATWAQAMPSDYQAALANQTKVVEYNESTAVVTYPITGTATGMSAASRSTKVISFPATNGSARTECSASLSVRSPGTGIQSSVAGGEATLLLYAEDGWRRVDPATCAVSWTAPATASNGPHVLGESSFVTSGAKTVALTLATGTAAWTGDFGTPRSIRDGVATFVEGSAAAGHVTLKWVTAATGKPARPPVTVSGASPDSVIEDPLSGASYVLAKSELTRYAATGSAEKLTPDVDPELHLAAVCGDRLWTSTVPTNGLSDAVGTHQMFNVRAMPPVLIGESMYPSMCLDETTDVVGGHLRVLPPLS